MAPLGIKVIVVEPGLFRTDFSGRSIVASKTDIADYDATAGERRRQIFTRGGTQAGDWVRAAKAIIDALDSPEPPAHLELGKMTLDLAGKDLEAKKRDFDSWEAVMLGLDFPE